MKGTVLTSADLSRSDLTGTVLANAHLVDANLDCTNLDRVDLAEAQLLSTARAQELLDVSQANRDLSRPPFANVPIRKRAEVLWIQQQHADPGSPLHGHGPLNLEYADLAGAMLCRASLREVSLHGASLGAADLREADMTASALRGADLTFANLNGATLLGVDMTPGKDGKKTLLSHANLTGANLVSANLAHADLASAQLPGANLEGAILQGTNLGRANLRGAGLQAVRVDSGTIIAGVELDSNTLLGQINWNTGISLQEVDWGRMPTLGDEVPMQRALSEGGRKGCDSACFETVRRAVGAYHGLANALRGQGLNSDASRYRLREQQLDRARLRVELAHASWRREPRKTVGLLGSVAFSYVLDFVAGYGERPGQAFRNSAIAVLLFALAYWIIRHLAGPTGTMPWDYLAMSVVTFLARGFALGISLSLGTSGILPANSPLWVVTLFTWIGLFEAALGFFIEIIFIAAFTRRFLG